MEEDKKPDVTNERVSGKSGSVEEIGFGLSQKDRRNEVEEAMVGIEGGRQREKAEEGGQFRCEWEGGMEG